MIPLQKAALRLFPASALQEKYSSVMNTLWNQAILLPATRFLLQNVITFPFTFMPYLAGIVADHWGFVPLFAGAGVFALVNTALAAGLRPAEGLQD